MRSVQLIAATIIVSLALSGAALGDDDQKAPVHKVTQSASYMMNDPMYATITYDDRLVGLLMVAVGSDVPDAGLRGEADHAMPVRRAAYMRSPDGIQRNRRAAVRAARRRGHRQSPAARHRLALGRKGAHVLLAQVAMRITK